MNKKTISLFLIFPILSACHGTFISKDYAKEIATSLNTYLNEVKVDDYPVENFVRKGESFDGTNKVVTKSIYSKSKMFYYSYVITYPSDGSKVIARENWIYGWTTSSEYNIYTVFRDNGGEYLPAPGRSSMEEKYPNLEEFNVAWGEIDAAIEKGSIIADSLSSVEKIQEIISYIEGDEISVSYQFSSFDNTSVHYKGNYDTTGDYFGKVEPIHNLHEIDIFSAKVISYSSEYYGDDESLKRYENYSYNFDVPEVVYPKIN